MPTERRFHWSFLLALLCCIGVALMFWTTRQWNNLAMYGVIHADAQGYYGYLVAAFLQHTFDWEQVIGSYEHTYFNGSAPDFTVMTEHGRINKYYAGTAVLMFPFFLLGCAVAWLTGQPVDGYSMPFQHSVRLAALFYAMAGLYLLGRYLVRKGLSWPVVSVVVTGVFAGTGLFHYTMMEPGMSHVYSFFLFCAFIFLADRAIALPDRRHLLPLAAVLALIALVRPVNLLIVLSLPFLAGGWRPFILFIRAVFSEKKQSILPALLAVGIVAIQPLTYVLQVGRPFVWSYSGEGFNFLDPEMVNVLFSFRKGLFVYYPWTLLACFGIVALYLRSKAAAIWLAVFLFVAVYVISSWWVWYYGGGFGLRALVEYLPFFAVLMAHLLHTLPRPATWAVAMISLLAVPLNLVQTYQYSKFIIHWASMDRDRYWQVFLKTDQQFEGVFFREEQQAAIAEQVVLHRQSFFTDLEDESPQWGTQGRTDALAHSGRFASRLTKQNPYGTTIGIPFADMGPAGKKRLIASFMVWAEVEQAPLELAYSYNSGERHYGHNYLPCRDQIAKAGEWTEVRTQVDLPAPETDADVLIIYPYTSGSGVIYVDDIRYEFLTMEEAQ